MDPQIAWEQLLSAYAEGDWDRIVEHGEALLDWLDRGGFPPRVMNHPGLGSDWDRMLTRAGCLFALENVQSEWRPA